MALVCPNKNSSEWKALVKRVGEQSAYSLFIDAGFDIPKLDARGLTNLENDIVDFLQRVGFTFQMAKGIKDSQGNYISAIAKADMLNGIVQVVEGRRDDSTLPEEASHVIVDMLEASKSPLFRSMYTEIPNHSIYAETLREYGQLADYDQRKLRKEAMAKMIGKVIQNKDVKNRELVRPTQWWNKVLNFLKGFLTPHKAEINSFERAANLIYDKAVQPFRGTDSYYQLSNSNTSDNDSLNKLDTDQAKITYSETDKEYSFEGKKIKNRVSNLVKKLDTKFTDRSKKDQAMDDIKAKYGTRGHAAFQNIINRAIEARNGVNNTARDSHGLPLNIYTQLEDYVKQLVAAYPTAEFRTEVRIFDPRIDMAGTIDLLIVEPDGTANIYDWKFIDFKPDKSGKINAVIPAWYKRDNWDTQLSKYRTILRDVYGFKKIGKTRVVPISAIYNSNPLTGKTSLVNVKVGSFDPTKAEEYLRPVPVPTESTGSDLLDKLIAKLNDRQKQLREMRVKGNDAQLRNERTEALARTVRDLQLGVGLSNLGTYIKLEVAHIEKQGVENLSEAQLLDYYESFKTYGVLAQEGYFEDTFFKVGSDEEIQNYKDYVARVSQITQSYIPSLKGEIDKRTQDKIDKSGAKNIGVTLTDNFWNRQIRTISQSNNRFVQAFRSMVNKQDEKIEQETKNFRSEVEKYKQPVLDWAAKRGISGERIFDKMLKVKGNRLQLIDRSSSEYYDERKRIINDDRMSDAAKLKWFKENSDPILSKAEYEQKLKDYTETATALSRAYANPAEHVKRKVEEFKYKYNFWEDKYALSAYKTERGYLAKENWASKELKELQKPENKPLYDFYKFYVESIEQIRNDTGKSYGALPNTFVPNIQKGWLASIQSKGLNGLSDEIMKSVVKNEWDGQDKDSRQVPFLFLSNINAENKSRDLFTSLAMFKESALKHQHLEEIEGASKLLVSAYREDQQVVTDGKGRAKTNAVTNQLIKAGVDSDNLETLQRYVDALLYGVNIEDQDRSYKVKVFGKEVEISRNKSVLTAMKYHSGVALFGNLVSGAANLFGGGANAFFEASKGRFFNGGELTKGMTKLSSADKKMYAMLEFFDAQSENSSYEKSKKLSVMGIEKKLGFDGAFFLQRGTENMVQNITIAAYLEGMTLKDGRLVKKTEESQKSLYDLAVINKEGKLEIEGLEEAQFQKVRRQVKELNSQILGTLPDRDVRLLHQSLMGRMLLQFRNWMPRMLDERFGGLRYNQTLEVWEQGKYSTALSYIANGKGLALAEDLLRTSASLLPFINNSGITVKSKEWLQSLRAELAEKNPNVENMTDDELVAMYEQNLKSLVSEVFTVLAFFTAAAMFKPDDDDEDDTIQKYIYKTADRSATELSFFLNPESFTEIFNKPVALVGLATNIFRFFKAIGQFGYGSLFDQEVADNAKVAKSARKLGLGFNTFEMYLNVTDQNK